MVDTSEVFFAILLYSLSAFFSIAVNVVFILRAKKSSLLKAFLNVQYMIILWLIANVLKKAAPNEEVAWLWVVVQYMSVCMFGATFIDFGYLYRFGHQMRIKYRRVIYGLSGINYIVLFTNPVHHLFYTSYTLVESVNGPLFYVHMYWSYTLLGVAYIYILSALFKDFYSVPFYRVVLFSAGLMTPIFVNVSYVFNWSSVGFDLTPVTFNMTILVFGYTAYRYRFLDIKKVSRVMVLENIHEGIIVVDTNNRIVLKNPLIEESIINYGSISKTTDFLTFISSIGNKIPDEDEIVKKIRGAMVLDVHRLTEEVTIMINGKLKTLVMKMDRLDDTAGDKIGYVFRLIDITQVRELLSSVEEKNEALIRVNEQLSENITATKQLTVARERSRISKEIHDILGHTMTVVISLLEIASHSIEEDCQLAKEKVGQSMEIMRGGLGDLKNSMRKNSGGDIDANILSEELFSLIEDFEQSGIKVDYFYKLSSVKLASEVYDTIFRICQEALTNALKHGRAKNVTLGLRYVERHIDLFIIDDGSGCLNMIKGNGIKGMENRVNKLNGYFSCGSPEGDGFNIHVTLPYNGSAD